MRTKDSEISGKSADIAERAQQTTKKQGVHKSGQEIKASVHKSGQAVNSSASTKVDRAKAGCPQKWTGQKQASTKAARAKPGCPQRWTSNKKVCPQKWTEQKQASVKADK